MPRRGVGGGGGGGGAWRTAAGQVQVQALVLVLVLVLVLAPVQAQAMGMSAARMAELRRATVDMFYHGFDNYMAIAFPEDELRPVSCVPLTRDTRNPRNNELNDVLGNYSLTLIDSLSTLAILASAPAEDVDDEGGATGARALRDFQDGVAALVAQYGDGRHNNNTRSGQGQRGRGFDVDSKVQVFETVIRGVGGLLSAHLFAVGMLPITNYTPPAAAAKVDLSVDPPEPETPPIAWPNGLVYDGQLLRLALDLATRLLPAFYTPTGMPYPRVNLRHGIPFYVNSPLHGQGRGTTRRKGAQQKQGPPEITETCSAGAGSLVLEFAVLSRLTGDGRFEQLAKRAFWAVWYRRSDIGLIGAGVDAEQGRWIGGYAVIGAGADSFFEYALKTHILLSGQDVPNGTAQAGPPPPDDGNFAETPLAWHDPNTLFPALSDAENSPDAFLEAWHLAHAAIKRHLYSDREHPHYVNVNLWTGSLAAQWIDSLGAYYPGLLTLAGEVDEAVATNLLYTAVWAKYAALPERWSVAGRSVEGGLGWWPLRPEFIESVYHLYRATRDPWYLYVGDMVQRDIERRCRTRCGWAGLQNVVTGEQSDRMESFFLGETAKYMYLLYDDQHPLNALDAAYVFTTEGHPLVLPPPRADDRTNKNKFKNENKKTTEKDTPAADKKVRTRSGIPAGLPGQLQQSASSGSAAGDLGVYGDEGFATTCPRPPAKDPWTGSAITGRDDLFHAAKMVRLDSDDAKTNANTNTTNYFLWTLPPAMLPLNGTSAPVQEPTELTLEFSTDANPLAAVTASIAGLSRIGPSKIRIHSISGLKLVFRLGETDDNGGGERVWQVTRVNGVPLGRDESVVVDRALIHHISDPRFAMVRDATVVKLHHLHHATWHQEEEEEEAEEEGEDREPEAVLLRKNGRVYGSSAGSASASSSSSTTGSKNHPIPPERLREALTQRMQTPAATGLTTLVKSVWQQLVSSLDGPARATPASGSKARTRKAPPAGAGAGAGAGAAAAIVNVVLNATGVTPTGPGAASLPAVDVAAGAAFPATGAVPNTMLPWHTVYAGGRACSVNDDDEHGQPTGPLPETAVRDHQVLVLRRGGCSFSEKMANIPSFVHGPRSLQLVVVVSDDDDVRVNANGNANANANTDGMTFHDDIQDFVRPLLEEQQRTPGGLVRWQPLAMVMVGGGDTTYTLLSEARQLGLTRRYVVESQGLHVRNLIVDDGDDL